MPSLRTSLLRGSALVVVSLVLASLASAFWLFVPTVAYEEAGGGAEAGSSPVEVVPVERGRSTLLEEEGSGVLIALAIPVAVAALALAVDRTRARRVSRTAAAVLLAAFSFVALFSIGLSYVPSALAMVAAAAIAFTQPARE